MRNEKYKDNRICPGCGRLMNASQDFARGDGGPGGKGFLFCNNCLEVWKDPETGEFGSKTHMLDYARDKAKKGAEDYLPDYVKQQLGIE